MAADDSHLKMFLELESNIEEALDDFQGGLSKLNSQMDNINKAMQDVGVNLDNVTTQGAEKLTGELKIHRDIIYAINKDLETKTKLSKLDSENMEKYVESLGKKFNMTSEQLDEYKESIENLTKGVDVVKQQKEFEKALLSSDEALTNLVNKDFAKFSEGIKQSVSVFGEIGNMISDTGGSIIKAFDSAGILAPITQFAKSAYKMFKNYFIKPVMDNLKGVLTNRIKQTMRRKKLEDGRTILYKKDLKINMEILKVLREQNKVKGNLKLESGALRGKGAGGGGGGGDGIPLGGGGMGGMGKGMKGLSGGAAAAAAALAVVAIAVAAVVAAVKTAVKILEETSKVMEEFHTINFQLAGGQRQLAIDIADVTMTGQYLLKEVQSTVKALGEWGFTAEQLHESNMKLVKTTAAFARVTGVADEIVAKFYKTQLGFGSTMKTSNKQLGYAMILMKEYGLTSADVSSILQSTTDISHILVQSFEYTAESVANATMAMGKLAASAKKLGIDVSEATAFYKELTTTAEKYIVATAGKSLFQGPTETLADLMKQSDQIENVVRALPVGMRSKFRQQLFGLNDKQTRMIMSMKEEHAKWAKAEKDAAKQRGETLTKLDLSEEKFLKAAGKADDMIDNVENLAKQSNENFSRQMDLIKDKFLSIFIKLGAQIMPFVIEVFDFVAGVFDTIAKNFTKILTTLDKALTYMSPAYFGAKKALGIKDFDEESLEKQAREREKQRNELLGITNEFKELKKQVDTINDAKKEQVILERRAKSIREEMHAGDKAAEAQLENIVLQKKAWNRVLEDVELSAQEGKAVSSEDMRELFKEAYKEEQRLAKKAEAREKKMNEEAVASKTRSSTATAIEKEDVEEKTRGATPTRYNPAINELERLVRGVYGKDAEKILDTKDVADEVAKLRDGQTSTVEVLERIANNMRKRGWDPYKPNSIDWGND